MRNTIVLTAISLLAAGCLTTVEPSGVTNETTANAALSGTDSVSVGPFSIIVSDTPYGSVTLSWTAPTENEDGSTLTDLDGYRLYWGKTPGDYSDSITVDNESITTFVVENIPSGTYEFVATSFNMAGIESRYSNPATKVVP